MERVVGRMRSLPRGLRLVVLTTLVAAVALAVLSRPPVFQDLAYFGHADRRTLLGLPNALNVLSNLPFALAAWLGLRRCATLAESQRTAARITFLSIGAVTIGSGYYHLAPSSVGLLVDRLPISLAFAALFAWVLGDRLGERWSARMLAPMVALALGTLWIWYGSGALDGDLRPYALVQALPLACLPLLLAFFPGELDDRRLALALVLYVVAKLCEFLDASLYAFGELVSGHTLKHLFAATACLALVPRRSPSAPEDEQVAEAVGRDEVELAVAVDVGRRDEVAESR
jgi:hypothetical protein